mmetsp:Transcript_40253/g.125916  ORF Transcript_40253/g.125916 Transcript_40253/m.125916 type:complete len:258 (-) Transcript_40253:54-827(-)
MLTQVIRGVAPRVLAHLIDVLAVLLLAPRTPQPLEEILKRAPRQPTTARRVHPIPYARRLLRLLGLLALLIRVVILHRVVVGVIRISLPALCCLCDLRLYLRRRGRGLPLCRFGFGLGRRRQTQGERPRLFLGHLRIGLRRRPKRKSRRCRLTAQVRGRSCGSCRSAERKARSSRRLGSPKRQPRRLRLLRLRRNTRPEAEARARSAPSRRRSSSTAAGTKAELRTAAARRGTRLRLAVAEYRAAQVQAEAARRLWC